MVEPSRPSVRSTQGMVAAPHPLATEAGISVLQDGGSAVDAAIAANAVLTVIYPDQTAIGGDCFMLLYDARTGSLHGYNGSGRAPRGTNRAALRADGTGRMPVRGIATVTVPGTIEAWSTVSERYGRLGLDRLLAPAIALAEDGFPVSRSLAERLGLVSDLLVANDALAARFLPGGSAPHPGQTIDLPDLAAALRLIAKLGASGFYQGQLADAIIATSERLGGTLTAADLTNHAGEWVTPVTTTYDGITVAELPPNSQGVTALVALNLVESEGSAPTWGSADHLHPMIEAKKVAFAVRDGMLADPAFVPIDTERLASKAFATALWGAYDPSRAAGGTASRPGDTVAVCTVDRDGNAASLIQSIYMAFGSGIVADGTGIVLQNRGTAFSLEDDHPNRIEGGKRPLHTLMPGMLLQDGRLLGPFATQGGDAQAQVHLQLVTNIVDYRMEPQAAIDAPRWIAGGPTATAVTLEARFAASTIEGLAARGHDVAVTRAWDPAFGHAQMILIDEETGALRGGADGRADGVALGT